ncbi:anti-sigma factor antagonist [Streptomyces sp. NPDC031705]|uniref:anti-sigma factor antagonist n=1 Tax=unclassified Streptomyces TaxID=2593676 RepID=UPI0033E27AC8
MTLTMQCGPLAPAVPADGLRITVEQREPGTALVTVSGEVDFHSAAALLETLLAALLSYRTAVAVDLGQVTFCDCAGLNALLAARAAADRAHRRMRVTTTSRRVDRLLHLTGTRRYLT